MLSHTKRQAHKQCHNLALVWNQGEMITVNQVLREQNRLYDFICIWDWYLKFAKP